MSHKFINNLTVILGSCELLKEAKLGSPDCKRRLDLWAPTTRGNERSRMLRMNR